MSDFHHPNGLVYLFNHIFLKSHNTILAYGKDEPLYLPANEARPHNVIYFAHGFFNSALHECAHWMIAGKERRQLEDYGYWYEPDGRNAEQQTLFQQVEVKPQALEWIFSQAAGSKFECSFDNLNAPVEDYEQFKSAVQKQMLEYQKNGLPRRARIFYEALVSYYQ
ncbi:MAG: elongation factor P hydroxylase [Pseudomonadota bacterium]